MLLKIWGVGECPLPPTTHTHTIQNPACKEVDTCRVSGSSWLPKVRTCYRERTHLLLLLGLTVNPVLTAG